MVIIVGDTNIGYVYFFLNINDNTIKIGFTKNIEQRRKSLSTGSSGKLALLGYIRSDISLEKELHKQFENCRIRHNGEWFDPFTSPDLIHYLNENNDIKDNWIELDDGKVRIYKRMKNL